jgi:hypothetical protein
MIGDVKHSIGRGRRRSPNHLAARHRHTNLRLNEPRCASLSGIIKAMFANSDEAFPRF